MRVWVILLVTTLLLAGCATQTPSSSPKPGPVTVSTVGHNPPTDPTAPTPSGQAPPVDGGSIELTFTASNGTALAGAAVHFELSALFRDGAGGAATPANPSWRVVRSIAESSDDVASGTALPSAFDAVFAAPGTYQVKASVRADGYAEQSVAMDVAVSAAAAPVASSTCVRATSLADPTVMPAKDLGFGDGEPNIEVAPDGTIYINPVSPLYRSTDGGKTFKTVGVTDGHGDGDLAVTADGRLHWLGLSGNAGAIPYQYSDDRGATFNGGKDLSEGSGSDREWIDATPDGTVYASWRDGDGNIETRTSFDNGATWSKNHAMGPDGVGGQLLHGSLPHSVYELITRGTTLTLAASHDDGFTWKETHVADLEAGSFGDPIMQASAIFPTVAVDCAGTLYGVFADLNGELPTELTPRLGRYGVFMTVSHDDGKTWSKPSMISTPGHAAVMAWAVAGGPGKVAAVWYENVNGIPSANLPDEWNVMLWESVTADQPAPVAKTVMLTASPNHLGSVCTSGLICIAGGDRSLLDFFEVTLDNEGQPVATWMSSTLGTGVGLAVQGPDVWYGGLSAGTPLN